MTQLEMIVTEFIALVEMLEETEPIQNERIVLERERFRSLLEKYLYMKFIDKVKAYKDLNFIIHDKNNYTMPYRDTEKKKTVRKVIINYGTYQTIKRLYNTKINR